jgi:hypothetical protein
MMRATNEKRRRETRKKADEVSKHHHHSSSSSRKTPTPFAIDICTCSIMMHSAMAATVPRVLVPAIRGSTRSSLNSSFRRLPEWNQILRLSVNNGSLMVNRPSSSASFSTQSSESSSGGIRGWMEDRTQRKQHAEYMEQMKRLSEMDELTMENYMGELERGLNQWGAKVSFLQTKEIKTAHEVVGVVKALIDVKGGDATADDLLNMDRLERLKVATASNKTVEEISILMSQIQNMDLMQRTLRKRHKEGKPIPPDPQSMQAVIKKDALSVMTKSQKDMMIKKQASMAKRAMRKRR